MTEMGSEAPTSSTNRGLLPSLTGVRFLLAFHVLIFHCHMAFGSWPDWSVNVIGSGYVAVSMFFVLSGFVLTYTYLAPGSGGRVDPRPFFSARVARIYPLYLVGLLAMVPFAFLLAKAAPPGFFGPMAGLAHIFTLQTWFPNLVATWNGPGWSIGCEFFFYLTFPLLGPWLLRRFESRGLSWMILALWLCALAIPIIYVVVDPEGFGFLPGSGWDMVTPRPWIRVVKYNPILHLPEFAMGIALGGVFLADLKNGRKRNGAFLSISGATAILVVLAFSRQIPYPILHNGLVAPAFGLVVLGLAHRGGVLDRFLSTSPLVLLGNASYALYILQFPVMFLARLIGRAPDFSQMSYVFLLGYVGLMLVVSVLAFKYVETPARRWIRRHARD